MGYLCPVAFQAAHAALLPAPYALLRVTPSSGRAAELALWAAGPTCPTGFWDHCDRKDPEHTVLEREIIYLRRFFFTPDSFPDVASAA